MSSVSFATEPTPADSADEALEGIARGELLDDDALRLDDEGRPVRHLRPAAHRGGHECREQAEEEDVDQETPQAVEAAEQADEEGGAVVFTHGIS